MPEGATAVVYNLLGTAVAEVAEPAADLAQLPAGIYLAKVSMDGNNTIIRFKKIINPLSCTPYPYSRECGVLFKKTDTPPTGGKRPAETTSGDSLILSRKTTYTY